jgi:hypothetical protein
MMSVTRPTAPTLAQEIQQVDEDGMDTMTEQSEPTSSMPLTAPLTFPPMSQATSTQNSAGPRTSVLSNQRGTS